LNVSAEEVRRQTRRVLQESPVQGRYPSANPITGKLNLPQPENPPRPPIFEDLISAVFAAAQALITPSTEDEAQLKSTISLFILGDWQPVLKRAIDEAKTSRHDLVRTEDLLLAFVSDPSEYPAYLLRALGLRWEEAREKISHRSVEKQGTVKELAQEKSGEQNAPGNETGFTAFAIKALALGASQALHQIKPALIA